MNTILPTHHFDSQRGVALVVSMVMLVVITLIGVMVMNGSRLEWLMTNNSRFQSDAETRAEATLTVAENDITTNFITANPNGAVSSFAWPNPDQFYSSSSPLVPDPRNLTNWTGAFSSGDASAAIGAPAGTANNYVIEYLGCAPQPVLPPSGCYYGGTFLLTFRAWARSTDAKGTARIAQEIYSISCKPSGNLFKPTSCSTNRAFADL